MMMMTVTMSLLGAVFNHSAWAKTLDHYDDDGGENYDAIILIL